MYKKSLCVQDSKYYIGNKDIIPFIGKVEEFHFTNRSSTRKGLTNMFWQMELLQHSKREFHRETKRSCSQSYQQGTGK